MKNLATGDKAPHFALSDQNGNQVTLADFKGEKLLVYFYPRADTPGCTKQSCAVSEARPDLANRSVRAVGISPDKPPALKKFDDKYHLDFPLLSDPDHKVAGAFGAFGTKVRDGKTSEGIIRSSFLIDEEGKVLEAWYNVKPEETVLKALSRLDGPEHR